MLKNQMSSLIKKLNLVLLSGVFIQCVEAGEVAILEAKLTQQSNNLWSLSVTLKHQDTGWDHYADNWRLVDANGIILGSRVLYHPHVNEQPFTRSLNGIQIPEHFIEQGETLFIEAHDKRHGWSKNPLPMDLNHLKKGRLRVSQVIY